MLKAPGFSGGPFPAKFTDLKLRLADMDAQGVQVHALSLTRPMPYFGPPDYALDWRAPSMTGRAGRIFSTRIVSWG